MRRTVRVPSLIATFPGHLWAAREIKPSDTLCRSLKGLIEKTSTGRQASLSPAGSAHEHRRWLESAFAVPSLSAGRLAQGAFVRELHEEGKKGKVLCANNCEEISVFLLAHPAVPIQSFPAWSSVTKPQGGARVTQFLAGCSVLADAKITSRFSPVRLLLHPSTLTISWALSGSGQKPHKPCFPCLHHFD